MILERRKEAAEQLQTLIKNRKALYGSGLLHDIKRLYI